MNWPELSTTDLPDLAGQALPIEGAASSVGQQVSQVQDGNGSDFRGVEDELLLDG